MTSSKKTANKAIHIAIGILRFATIGTLGLIAWLNVKPYIFAVDFLVYGDGQIGFIQFLQAIPFIGWIVGIIRQIGSFVLGVLLWGVIQICEVLPTMMGSSPLVQDMIEGITGFKPMPEQSGGLAGRLTQVYNSRPLRWIQRMRIIAVGAYLIDLLIVLVAYPPVDGGVDGLMLWIAAPSLATLDLLNLLLLVVTLFAFEVGIYLLDFIWEGIDLGFIKKRGKQQP